MTRADVKTYTFLAGFTSHTAGFATVTVRAASEAEAREMLEANDPATVDTQEIKEEYYEEFYWNPTTATLLGE